MSDKKIPEDIRKYLNAHCDCTAYCGSDPMIKTGERIPCELYKKQQEAEKAVDEKASGVLDLFYSSFGQSGGNVQFLILRDEFLAYERKIESLKQQLEANKQTIEDLEQQLAEHQKVIKESTELLEKSAHPFDKAALLLRGLIKESPHD